MPNPTCQDVIDLARESLNDDGDDAERRWPDARCMKFLQDGLDAILEIRPDLFIGQFGTFKSFDLVIGADFPLEGRYRRVVADYIIMRCEMGDEESVVSQRVKLAYDFFASRLVKGA